MYPDNLFNHYDGEPRKYETNEICQIMDTQIIGWKRGGYHRFSKEGFGTQRCWIREGKDETETVNQPDKDGFIKLTEGEQMKIPFEVFYLLHFYLEYGTGLCHLEIL